MEMAVRFSFTVQYVVTISILAAQALCNGYLCCVSLRAMTSHMTITLL